MTLLSAVTLLEACLIPAVGKDDQTGPSSSPPVPTTAPAPHTWLVDLSTTGFPAGVSSETAYEAYLDSRAEALIQAADAADSQGNSVALRLGAANWILARQIEPAVTRFLLGQPDPGDAERLASAASQAQTQLERARPALSSQPASAPGEGQTRRGVGMDRQGEVLRVFSRVVSAAFDLGDPQALVDRRTQAALDLAVLLEEDQPEWAAAATVWQAILLEQLGSPDRALERLPPATTPLVAGGERFGFYARLLRCRLLADRGEPVASCSLLMQIERRCEDWFPTARDRADARRTAAWFRARALQRWHDAMDASADAERQWCRRQIEAIRQAFHQSGDRPTLMRLGVAVPVVVESSAPPAAPDSGTAARRHPKLLRASIVPAPGGAGKTIAGRGLRAPTRAK